MAAELATISTMPNLQMYHHPLVGTEHVYRSDLPAYDPESDTEPGQLVVAPGHTVTVLAAFKDWNDVAGLDMLAVRCHQTGIATHVTPAELGLGPLS